MSVAMRPVLPLRTALPVAVVAGVLLWLAFPPAGLGLSAVAGVALLAAAVWGARVRRGLGLGAVTGLVFFGLLLEWMRVIGPDAWLLLTLLCAAWIALAGAGMALVTRLPLAPLWIASVWVLVEALRGRVPLGGFPWGNLSFAQPDTLLGDGSWLGGLPYVSFVVVFVGSALVAVARAAGDRRRRRVAGWCASIAAVVLLPVLASPALGPSRSAGGGTGSADAATVAIVQGGTPQTGMGAMDVRRAVLDNHVAQTMDLAAAIEAGTAPQPQFVLWPENSSDIDPFADASVADAISTAARAVGVPILVGAVTSVPGDPGGVWNVGIVWDPERGPTQMYVKTHPVPFGEYVPFRDVLASLIGRFDRIPRDFRAGSEPGNLRIAGIDVGNVICFEIAYADVVDAVIDGGARLLTVQTNNATYGGTSQPAQQLAISRMRAGETGRHVLVAATSGVSAVIGADRQVEQEMGEDTTGWFIADAPLTDALTPASRIGHLLEAALCLIAVAAMVVAAVRRDRQANHPVAGRSLQGGESETPRLTR